MFKLLLIYAFFSVTLSFLNAFEISENIVIVKSKNSHIPDTAANDLAYYLSRITEKDIKVVQETPQGNTAIILTKASDKNLQDDTFKIIANDTRLTISAANERSILYGIYYFLDHYAGCKFLSVNYEYIPSYKRKDLGKIDEVQKPTFSYREIFMREGDDLLFSFKNLLNGRLGHRTAKDEAEEIYTSGIKTFSFTSAALLGEKYMCSGQYDYANKHAQHEALLKLDQELARIPKNQKSYVILEHEDRGSVCTSGLKRGETPSKAFLDYTRYLAENMAQKYPYITFFHQAYLWSREVPAHIPKLPANLGVHFAGIEANFAKPLQADENRKIWEDLIGWGKLTDNIIIWDYIINFGGYMFPFPNLNAVDKDIKAFAKKPFVKGVFLQGSYETYGGDLADLRIWVFAKLLWNPNHNLDDLIGEFCHYYYGAAAEDVIKYIRKLHILIAESRDKLSIKTSIDAAYLSNKNLDILDNILSEGVSKLKKGSDYYQHMMGLFTGIDYIRLIRGYQFQDRNHVKKRFKDYLSSHPEITAFAEGVSIENILKIIDLNKSTEKIPVQAKRLQKSREWLSYQEYQLELCCADIVEDPYASDGVSAVMPGNSKEWGFSLPLLNIPPGIWDIYADVKVEVKKESILDNARWALRYGIEPGFVKGIYLAGQFGKKYQSIKIGTIDTYHSDAEFIWLSPPGNDVVKHLYVDRIYFIKQK